MLIIGENFRARTQDVDFESRYQKVNGSGGIAGRAGERDACLRCILSLLVELFNNIQTISNYIQATCPFNVRQYDIHCR